MIIYNNRSWLEAFTHIQGTVLPNIVSPVLLIAGWSWFVASDIVFDKRTLHYDLNGPLHILGAFVSFFLIFRTRQAYGRYWQSNSVLKQIQMSCRQVHQQFLSYNMGGNNEKDPAKAAANEKSSTQAKTDATRYILAYCVAFKLHCRLGNDGYQHGRISQDKKQQVDYDRARLRGLLSDQEFIMMDNMLQIDHQPKRSFSWWGFQTHYEVGTEVACRSCHMIIFFLRCVCYQCSVSSKDWGWFERGLNLADNQLGKLMNAFEEMDQYITTPLPLPYCHLCKSLMFIFLLAFPLTGISIHETLAVHVMIPSIIAVAMFGLESISMEIEDSFGDDDNDFDTMRIISGIESSIYEAAGALPSEPRARAACV